MRTKQFERLLSERSSLSESEIDGRARRLREKGYLPKGGRGPYAPVLTADSAAVLIIATAHATQISDAVFAVANCEHLFHPQNGRSLKDTLTEFLDDPSTARMVDRVVIGRYPNARWAEVVWSEAESGIAKRSQTIAYRPKGKQPDRQELGIRVDATITGAFIAEVAAIIARTKQGVPEPGTSGWSGDVKDQADESRGAADK